MGTPRNYKVALAGGFAFAIAAVLMLSASVSNTAAQMANTTSTANETSTAKPVNGYDYPKGHINAVRHVFDYPTLRVKHFCKPNDKIMMVCQLYDGASPNATLIGVEYIITQEQYDSLSDREKPYWHAHRVELRPDRADPMMRTKPRGSNGGDE